MGAVIDISGKCFGRLKVLGLSRIEGQARWSCLCRCGNETEVPGHDLRSGHTTSCGCRKAEATSLAKKTHGRTGSTLYRTWARMKVRCFNENGLAVQQRRLDFSPCR